MTHLKRSGLLAALVALLVAAGCGSSATPPTSFGVNLTLRVDAAVRAQVKSIALHVTGAEQFEKTLDIGTFSGSEARMHYVPHVASGSLTFTADALSASATILASGTSGTITLVTGKAVAALVDIRGANSDAPVDAPTDGGTPDGTGGSGGDGGGETKPPGNKGEACSGAGSCAATLTCVDGYCCDTPCAGSCSACNLAGREGTCSPIAAGMAPAAGHTACAKDAASTCQHDGTCDGAGSCRLWPVGTTCRASRCDMATDAFTPEFKCDGAGVCQTNIAIACAPFKCKDALVCNSSCTDSTQCVAGKSCVNNSCGLKPKGAVCAAGSECMDGYCAEGVCCDRACTAGCESCNLPTARGTCTNIPSGMDPKGICPPGTAENATCSPGGCDGTGGTACRKAPTTTVCRAGTCAAGVAVNPATCQTNGICAPLTQTPCGVYVCGATACNTTCAADADCVAGYYCATNRSCQAKKAAGIACGTTNECTAGLTCLDGVCCMSSACPSCRNCGSTGACTVVVASADDNTGTTCSGTRSCNSGGSCLSVLGQSCGSASGCVSGNCVDGVCCSVASCGTCRNCGSTGACTVNVTNADDTSPNACMADQSCDGTSTCKARWMLVGKVVTVEAPEYMYTVGVGNYIYFANPNNSGGGAQFFKSFNVATNAFADENKTGNPLCACGYEGTLVGQPLNNRVYYAANSGDDKWYIAGAAAWTTLSGTYVARGEAATAVIGQRVYWAGGRGSLTTVQAYNTATDTWITSGIKETPVGVDSACAGAYNGVMYVFGGRSSTQMLAYTESSNSWAQLAVTSPAGCYYRNLPAWRGKLVMPDSGTGMLAAFNPTTQTWDPQLPLPTLGGFGSTVVAGSANDLFAVGWNAGSTYIYKWVFN